MHYSRSVAPSAQRALILNARPNALGNRSPVDKQDAFKDKKHTKNNNR